VRELRDKADSGTVKDFVSFLENRVDSKVKLVGGKITIDEGENAPSKAYLRVLIRKFLHQVELKEDFRVISSKENVFTIKERKEAREE
jgi:hypothetical protein